MQRCYVRVSLSPTFEKCESKEGRKEKKKKRGFCLVIFRARAFLCGGKKINTNG